MATANSHIAPIFAATRNSTKKKKHPTIVVALFLLLRVRSWNAGEKFRGTREVTQKWKWKRNDAKVLLGSVGGVVIVLVLDVGGGDAAGGPVVGGILRFDVFLFVVFLVHWVNQN